MTNPLSCQPPLSVGLDLRFFALRCWNLVQWAIADRLTLYKRSFMGSFPYQVRDRACAGKTVEYGVLTTGKVTVVLRFDVEFCFGFRYSSLRGGELFQQGKESAPQIACQSSGHYLPFRWRRCLRQQVGFVICQQVEVCIHIRLFLKSGFNFRGHWNHFRIGLIAGWNKPPDDDIFL